MSEATAVGASGSDQSPFASHGQLFRGTLFRLLSSHTTLTEPLFCLAALRLFLSENTAEERKCLLPSPFHGYYPKSRVSAFGAPAPPLHAPLLGWLPGVQGGPVSRGSAWHSTARMGSARQGWRRRQTGGEHGSWHTCTGVRAHVCKCVRARAHTLTHSHTRTVPLLRAPTGFPLRSPFGRSLLFILPWSSPPHRPAARAPLRAGSRPSSAFPLLTNPDRGGGRESCTLSDNELRTYCLSSPSLAGD